MIILCVQFQFFLALRAADSKMRHKMSSVWCCVVFLMVVSHIQANEPNLAGKEYVFELKEGDNICFYASFQLDFSISYLGYPNSSNTSVTDIMSTEVHLPNNSLVTTTGVCGENTTTLTLAWEDQDDKMYDSTFVFTLENGTWFASSISFTFNLTKFSNPVEMGVQTYVTDKNVANLFSRDFGRNEFFYCEKCKSFSFVNCSDESPGCVPPCPVNKNVSLCNSTLNMMQTVIYPGDIGKESASRKLCIEDYIALQELIVPIVVGGILGLLLLLIFVAYIIAYIRRRRREGKYERLSGNQTY